MINTPSGKDILNVKDTLRQINVYEQGLGTVLRIKCEREFEF